MEFPPDILPKTRPAFLANDRGRDDEQTDAQLRGGGQGYPSGTGGSEGGGSIRLQVGGALTIDGRLSANGHDGLQDDAGGGSGGSVWITANSLAGAGLIQAK